MSKDVAAAFMRMVARNVKLRDEITQLAARHGFRFSPDDLASLELDQLLAEDYEPDDRLSDRGFGAIETPA